MNERKFLTTKVTEYAEFAAKNRIVPFVGILFAIHDRLLVQS